MLLIRITMWTLRQLQQPHMVKSYDMRNAFGTGTLEDLLPTLTQRALATIEDREQESTEAFLHQRRMEAHVVIPTSEGPLTMRVGSGGTMGDISEPEAFMKNFYDTITPWAMDAYKAYSKSLVFRSPIDGTPVDGSWGAFIDDLIRIIPFLDGQSALDVFYWDNNNLDKYLEAAQYKQNTDKQETIVSWGERAARKKLMEEVDTTSRALPELKHLGAMLDPTGSNSAEIEARVKAMNVAWINMGAFWTSPAKFRVKRLAFMGLIYAVALSGLEAFVLLPGELRTLTKALTKKLRCMAAGRLTTYTEDEIRQPSEATLWRYWRLIPPGPELVIRRLRWYQRLAQDPDQNNQLLAVLFGQPRLCEELDFPAPIGNDGVVRDAETTNPWAKQWHTDIETLMASEGGCDLMIVWEPRDIRVLHSASEANDAFVRIDVNTLRSSHLTAKWAPDINHSLPDEENPPSDDDETVQCSIIHMGVRCKCKFNDFRSMRMHQSHSRLPGHLVRDAIAYTVMFNACIVCGTAFGSVHEVVQHLKGSWSMGRCIVGGTFNKHVLNTDDGQLVCHVCSENKRYNDFKTYSSHMCTHLPPSPFGSIRMVQAAAHTKPSSRRVTPSQPLAVKRATYRTRTATRSRSRTTSPRPSRTLAREKVAAALTRASSSPSVRRLLVAEKPTRSRSVAVRREVHVATRASKANFLRRHSFPQISKDNWYEDETGNALELLAASVAPVEVENSVNVVEAGTAEGTTKKQVGKKDRAPDRGVGVGGTPGRIYGAVERWWQNKARSARPPEDREQTSSQGQRPEVDAGRHGEGESSGGAGCTSGMWSGVRHDRSPRRLSDRGGHREGGHGLRGDDERHSRGAGREPQGHA